MGKDQQLGEWLTAYIDGELDAHERARVELMLARSAPARQMLAELRRTAELLRSLSRHAAQASIVEDVRHRLERNELLGEVDGQSSLRAGPLRTLMVLSGWAAMIALLAGGIWYVADLSRHAESPAPPSEALVARPHEDAPDGAAPAKLAKLMNLEEKLSAGLGTGEVLNHQFANEPIAMTVIASHELERNACARRLRARLKTDGITELTSPAPTTATSGSLGAFFMEGRAGTNFDEAGDREWLVRVPIHEASNLLLELADTSTGQVEMKVGPIRRRGSEPSRQMIRLLSEDQPSMQPEAVNAPSPTGKSPTRGAGGRGFAELFHTLGLNAVQRLVDRNQPRQDSTPTGQAHEPAGSAQTAADQSPDEHESLVARRTRDFERPDSGEPDQSTDADSEPVTAMAAEAAPLSPPVEPELDEPTDQSSYVTFVVRLVVSQPDPKAKASPPDTPARSPQDSTRARRSNAAGAGSQIE